MRYNIREVKLYVVEEGYTKIFETHDETYALQVAKALNDQHEKNQKALAESQKETEKAKAELEDLKSTLLPN